jgi:hypothetical protein
LYAGVWDAQQGGLYESRDGAATWNKRLNIGPHDYIAQIKLAPSQPSRIYLGGLVYDEQAKVFSFQVTRSNDAGQTWQRLYIPLAAEEEEASLLAVSPVDPETLLVLAANKDRGLGEDRVLISRDGGTSFKPLVHAVYLHSASFTPDGKTAFVAGDAALYRSDMALNEAAPFGAAQLMSYVTVDGQAVYACGNPSGFDPVNAGVGVSMDQATTFTKLMAFTEVKQTVMCPATSETARVCQDLWTDWQLEILVGVGGAPMDSVAGWMTFTPPDPAATMAPPKPNLTTAKATPPTAMSSGPAGNTQPHPVGSAAPAAAPSGSAAPAAHSSGCTIASERTSAPWWFGFGLGLALQLRRRLRSAARSR